MIAKLVKYLVMGIAASVGMLLGHSVILREGTLDFVHAHPVETKIQNGAVNFNVNFSEAGKYKIVTQFQREGRVYTTDFVATVVQGASSVDEDMPETDHSVH